MATGPHFGRSSNNTHFGVVLTSTNVRAASNLTVLNVDAHDQHFEAHFKEKYAEKLEFGNDNKIKWFGTFAELQVFVADLLNETGIWNSPGGRAKVYRSEEISITWYSDRNTLLFQGKLGPNMKQYVCNLVEGHEQFVVNGQANSGAVSQLITELDLPKVAEEIIQNKCPKTQSPDGQTKCKCRCISLADVIEDIKLDIEILKTRADSLQAFASTQEIVFPVNNYEKQIERLERELAEEKDKIKKLDAELLASKQLFRDMNGREQFSINSSKINNPNVESITSLHVNNLSIEVIEVEPVSTNEQSSSSLVKEVNCIDDSGSLTFQFKDNSHCPSAVTALSENCRSRTNQQMNSKSNYNRVSPVKQSKFNHHSQAVIHPQVNRNPTELKYANNGQASRQHNYNKFNLAKQSQVNHPSLDWMGHLPLIEIPMAVDNNSSQFSHPRVAMKNETGKIKQHKFFRSRTSKKKEWLNYLEFVRRTLQ